MGNEVSKFTDECRIGMKWRIKEADLRNVQGRGCLTSKTFKANIPGVKYCLKIYPNGRNESEENQIGWFLHLQFNAATEINVCVAIYVKSASLWLPIQNICFNSESNERGRLYNTTARLFNPNWKYFVDGYMEVELEGTLKDLQVYPKVALPLSLCELLRENDDKDVTIVADNKELKIHKLILTACSPVFKTELESQFQEALDNKIVITDFCYDTVKMVVDFCYELDIDDGIKINASEILHFADKYDMKRLHDYVQTKLIEILSESNVCKFANASITSNSSELREYCVCFLVNAAKHSKSIDGTENLGDEIKSEIAGRSFIFVSE